MLNVTPAVSPPATSQRRFGLALAGGGPLGAFYEIGALHAVGEAFEGFDLTHLEMYAGVSSGAMITAGLANGYDPADMGLVFINNASLEYPLRPGLFLRPALGEFAHRIASLPRIGLETLAQYVRDPGKDWAEALDPLGRALPTGLCDNRPFERFLRRMFEGPGRTNDFRELAGRLYVIATDLNSGSSVRFGTPGFDHVPISRAIQASTALPGLYPPVEIEGRTFVDGALMRTMNASILLEAGVDFCVCVNPLVAFDAAAARPALRERQDLSRGGLVSVLGQTFRALIQSRMQVGMATYADRYPTSDLLLLEPDRSDEQMFFKNVFRYSDRRQLAEHAYERTRRDLLAQGERLEPVLARHGIRLRRDLLADPGRSFQTAVRERGRRLQPVTGSLHRTLDRLETAISALR